MNLLRNSLLCALAAMGALAADAQTFGTVANPTIPSEYEFAGENVSLKTVDRAERFDRELTAMAFTHGNTLLQLKRANRVFPVVIPILKANGVPTDLVYLACIESQLNERAVSPAKAAGLWQFMPATAREYGLEVNEYVDERYDIEKATEAACRYLKNARSKYGNWESAAASYNAGMGRISRELDAQDQQSAFDLWLPDETMRYIFRLLAAKAIMENPRSFGYTLDASQLYQPFEYDLVEVAEPVDDWAQWGLDHGTNYYTVRLHNPWIRSKSLPNKDSKCYLVKIPKKDSLQRKHKNHFVYNQNWVK